MPASPARTPPRAERVGGVLFGKPLLALGYGGGWGPSACAPPVPFILGLLAVVPPSARPSLRFPLVARSLVPSLSTVPASLHSCFPRPRTVSLARSAVSVRVGSGSHRIPLVFSFLPLLALCSWLPFTLPPVKLSAVPTFSVGSVREVQWAVHRDDAAAMTPWRRVCG